MHHTTFTSYGSVFLDFIQSYYSKVTYWVPTSHERRLVSSTTCQTFYAYKLWIMRSGTVLNKRLMIYFSNLVLPFPFMIKWLDAMQQRHVVSSNWVTITSALPVTICTCGVNFLDKSMLIITKRYTYRNHNKNMKYGRSKHYPQVNGSLQKILTFLTSLSSQDLFPN